MESQLPSGISVLEDPNSTKLTNISIPILTQPMMIENARKQATFDCAQLTEIILGRYQLLLHFY